jgi:16S rRNA G966 N2-methylase RsmD
VFLDPPFGLGIGYCGEILQKLHKHKNTTENTIVYVETNSVRELNLDGWEIYKTKNFGRITSLLLTKKPL